MQVTNTKLITGAVIKTDFTDCKVVNPKPNTSGYMRILFIRKESSEVNSERLALFFTGEITAYEGEETPTPDEADKVFAYKVEFSLTYMGEFDPDTITDNIIDNEAFFKKDASVYFTRTAMSFLSDTKYKNVELPLQQ